MLRRTIVIGLKLPSPIFALCHHLKFSACGDLIKTIKLPIFCPARYYMTSNEGNSKEYIVNDGDGKMEAPPSAPLNVAVDDENQSSAEEAVKIVNSVETNRDEQNPIVEEPLSPELTAPQMKKRQIEECSPEPKEKAALQKSETVPTGVLMSPTLVATPPSLIKSLSESPTPPPINYHELPLDEKRKHYACGENFKVVNASEEADDVPRWKLQLMCYKNLPPPLGVPESKEEDDDLNMRVSLFQGDITQLEIDAIVNAANESLLGGGGVDGSIHRAAGKQLREECRALGGCETGKAKITKGHRLPARHVIHTVGPVGEKEALLESCYRECFDCLLQNDLSSIAFCCVSTGVFGYPNQKAAEVALRVAREYMEKHRDKITRVVFCCFLKIDFEIYSKLMATKYFPPAPKKESSISAESTEVPKASIDTNL